MSEDQGAGILALVILLVTALAVTGYLCSSVLVVVNNTMPTANNVTLALANPIFFYGFFITLAITVVVVLCLLAIVMR